MLAVLANLGQLHAWARWSTYALLALLTGLTFLLGAGLLTPFVPIPPDLLASDFDVNPRVTGPWLAITGALTLVSVAAAMLAFRRGQDPHLGHFYWSRPVHLAAFVFIALYAGGNLAFASVLDPSALTELGFSIGVGDVVAQYAGFVALALIGVGLGIRRNWRESQSRLKVNPLGIVDVGIAWSLTFAMVFMSITLGGIMALFSPQSTADATAFNQIITAAFSSPGGAILLGLLSGVGEELLYRGALQPVFGLWGTSLIFGLHHIQYLNPTLILIFALGLALGLIRNRWGTSTAALVHASYNAVLILLSLAALQASGG